MLVAGPAELRGHTLPDVDYVNDCIFPLLHPPESFSFYLPVFFYTFLPRTRFSHKLDVAPAPNLSGNATRVGHLSSECERWVSNVQEVWPKTSLNVRCHAKLNQRFVRSAIHTYIADRSHALAPLLYF